MPNQTGKLLVWHVFSPLSRSLTRTESLKVQDVFSLLSRSLTCIQSLKVQDVFSLLSRSLTCTQSLKVQHVFSLYSHGPYNMHTVPQGSTCTLSALRVPQGSSSICCHMFGWNVSNNDIQFAKIIPLIKTEFHPLVMFDDRPFLPCKFWSHVATLKPC